MAKSSVNHNDSGKGVAIAKRVKIDAAQKNMLVAVAIASIVLGITVVGIIFLLRTISFNATKISENDKVIEDFKNSQKQLDGLKDSVQKLASNERLEVVASERSNTKCNSEVLKDYLSENGFDLSNSGENIEIVRTCSALRAIADTLPSSKNQDATNSSLNWLVIHNDKDIMLEGLSGNDSISSVSIQDGSGSSLSMPALGVSVSIRDVPTKINRAITAIENSIRNFDITNVSISWSDYERGKNDSEIDFNASFKAYYSGSQSIVKKTKIICADDTNEKCVKAKGSATR